MHAEDVDGWPYWAAATDEAAVVGEAIADEPDGDAAADGGVPLLELAPEEKPELARRIHW